jgi:hypothetical protein
MEKVFSFYDLEGAAALSAALERFDRGRLVAGIVGMPVKCPVAPLEFCLLAGWYLSERGVRDNAEITFLTPPPGLLAAPLAGKTIEELYEEQRIQVEAGFHISSSMERPGVSSARKVAYRSTWRSLCPPSGARPTWAGHRGRVPSAA